MSQTIVVKSDKLGSFLWKLPEKLSERIEILPAELQGFVLDELKRLLTIQITLLLGAMAWTPAMPTLMELINERLGDLALDCTTELHRIRDEESSNDW